jgi:hypothetical protein
MGIEPGMMETNSYISYFFIVICISMRNQCWFLVWTENNILKLCILFSSNKKVGIWWFKPLLSVKIKCYCRPWQSIQGAE